MTKRVCPVDKFFTSPGKCGGTCRCKVITECQEANGVCGENGCLLRYAGSTCQKSCDYGFYDMPDSNDTCKGVCHCHDQQQCQVTTGRCLKYGCQLGYVGTSCQTKCSNYSFGDKCMAQCNCVDEMMCDFRTGACQLGCRPGYTGDDCQAKIKPPSTGATTWLGIGLGVGLSIMLLCVVFIVYRINTRNASRRKSSLKKEATGKTSILRSSGSQGSNSSVKSKASVRFSDLDAEWKISCMTDIPKERQSGMKTSMVWTTGVDCPDSEIKITRKKKKKQKGSGSH